MWTLATSMNLSVSLQLVDLGQSVGLIRIFYSSFPLKELIIKSNNNPWITTGTRINCKHKRDLYLLYRNSNDETLKIYYRRYCKVLKDVMREAKK
jgi:hypothetical protein